MGLGVVSIGQWFSGARKVIVGYGFVSFCCRLFYDVLSANRQHPLLRTVAVYLRRSKWCCGLTIFDFSRFVH